MDYDKILVPWELKKEDVKEDGTFKGYGSTFGGRPDSHGDIIVEGAFANTLLKGGRNRSGIAMLWQHDPTLPIGVWTSLVEDSRGLKGEGQLAIEATQGKDAYALMKLGALKGLSIGYDLPRDKDGKYNPEAFEVIEKNGKRTRFLKQIDLWEISPVTFPANTRARITTVKDIEDCATERELEKFLREVGLSKATAQYIVKLCKPSLRELGKVAEGGGEKEELNGVLEALQTVSANLT